MVNILVCTCFQQSKKYRSFLHFQYYFLEILSKHIGRKYSKQGCVKKSTCNIYLVYKCLTIRISYILTFTMQKNSNINLRILCLSHNFINFQILINYPHVTLPQTVYKKTIDVLRSCQLDLVFCSLEPIFSSWSTSGLIFY